MFWGSYVKCKNDIVGPIYTNGKTTFISNFDQLVRG